MSLEAELRQQLLYELTSVEGVPEIWLDALDEQDPAALFEAEPPSPTTGIELQERILHFCGEAIFRLAREIDELRASGAGGDDPG